MCLVLQQDGCLIRKALCKIKMQGSLLKKCLPFQDPAGGPEPSMEPVQRDTPRSWPCLSLWTAHKLTIWDVVPPDLWFSHSLYIGPYLRSFNLMIFYFTMVWKQYAFSRNRTLIFEFEFSWARDMQLDPLARCQAAATTPCPGKPSLE